MPRTSGLAIEASANEDRLAPDGATLSTFAQPPYRRRRILRAPRKRGRRHDLASLCNRFSRISSPVKLSCPDCSARRGSFRRAHVRDALIGWDHCYDVESRGGAHAFELARDAALLLGLAPSLGGPWLAHMLEDTELGVWWCRASIVFCRNHSVIACVRPSPIRVTKHPSRWGDVNQITYRNLIVGGLPSWMGFDRGPYPLPGSIATVSQGSIVRSGKTQVCVAPVYRFVTDLTEEAAWTSIPGGVDGSRFDATYTTWLDEHRAGLYHRIAPPALNED